MQINVIASSSKGNACLIEHGPHKLLIDAGINIKAIGKALAHRITDLDGCLISHEHMDHAKAVKELMRLGVDCYMSKGTAEALKLRGHRLHFMEAKRHYYGGSWTIMPIDLVHDAIEPLGFLIAIDQYKILYACDTAYIPYRFEGLTHIMVECNHSLDILREKISSGVLPPVMKRRLMQSHMNLDTFKQFLKANDLSKVEEIWLLHLSDNNSDEALFKSEIQKLTGKLIKIA